MLFDEDPVDPRFMIPKSEIFEFDLFGRRFVLNNQWKYERTLYLLPSVSLDFFDGVTVDISFLNLKFYTYKLYPAE